MKQNKIKYSVAEKLATASAAMLPLMTTAFAENAGSNLFGSLRNALTSLYGELRGVVSVAFVLVILLAGLMMFLPDDDITKMAKRWIKRAIWVLILILIAPLLYNWIFDLFPSVGIESLK